jgi:fructose-1,6-bisphosphatase/inositol monophosphatase family enzyme
MDFDLDQVLATMVGAAKAAGAIIKEGFEKDKSAMQVTFKHATDLVTDTDIAAEKRIKEILLSKYSEFKFIGEEEVSSGECKEELGDEPTFCVDPLDGTSNFAMRLPHVCTSIGFCVGREAVAGVVFNPILNEMYAARRGGGATLNGQAIQCAQTSELIECVVGTGFSADAADVDFLLANLRKVMLSTRCVRRCGAAALDMCYTASGIFETYFEGGAHGLFDGAKKSGPHVWDFAAGACIVREAGGIVADPYAGNGTRDAEPYDLCSRRILVAAPNIADKILGLLHYKQ